MKVLLDTCTFLWVVLDPGSLSETAEKTFRDPSNDVFLSAASAWEIAVKHALGNLPLPAPPTRLVPSERARHGIRELPIDEEAALRTGLLPFIHRDPFDRVLVAQAIGNAMTILTPDPDIARYPASTSW